MGFHICRVRAGQSLLAIFSIYIELTKNLSGYLAINLGFPTRLWGFDEQVPFLALRHVCCVFD